jgi:predicted nucleic acid-binding protein
VKAADGVAVDASALVFELIDAAGIGEWIGDRLRGTTVFSSEMVHYEVANQIRVHQRRGRIDATTANMAFQDLMEMEIHTEPFSVLANRVWELRGSVTSYDASYIAVAEWRRVPLLTTDLRLTRSNGARCEFLTPPDS